MRFPLWRSISGLIGSTILIVFFFIGTQKSYFLSIFCNLTFWGFRVYIDHKTEPAISCQIRGVHEAQQMDCLRIGWNTHFHDDLPVQTDAR